MLNDTALDTLFREARTHTHWLEKPVTDAQLQQIFSLMKWGPTSANCSPARLVFVRSPKEKDTLLSCMAAGNVEQTRTAPVTVIVGMDMAFYEKLPALFPHTDARAWFVGKPVLSDATAFRNSSLQGAYMMMAARSVGLDCGPMSGFDPDKMNASFFAGTTIKTNFVCNLGYGAADQLRPRSPRLTFEEACSIV